jgi:hypothetical protein
MKIKKIIYILLAMFLGLLLSVIAHALIEMNYLSNVYLVGMSPKENGCFLPETVQVVLPISGLIIGYILGQSWWQMVYVEKRHWSSKKGKRKKKEWNFKL